MQGIAHVSDQEKDACAIACMKRGKSGWKKLNMWKCWGEGPLSQSGMAG